VKRERERYILYFEFENASNDSTDDSDLAEFKTWCTKKGIITPLDLDVRTGDDDYRHFQCFDTGGNITISHHLIDTRERDRILSFHSSV